MSPALAPAGLAFAKAITDFQKLVFLSVGRHWATWNKHGTQNVIFVCHQLRGLGQETCSLWAWLFHFETGMRVFSPQVTGRIRLESAGKALVPKKSL